MAGEQSKISHESYPMIGGESSHSYAQNSVFQKGAVDATKEMIIKAVEDTLDFKNFSFDDSNTFRIADFGCSTGPNTFISVENIIEAVELKYYGQFQNHSSLEFQAFFNDHINNDFNTLFKNFPTPCRYFAAGVPGSFHGLLFPKSTLHLGHSSYALHWLSKVPEDVVDTKSPAWNKDRISYTGSVKDVAEAYSVQFKHDMESFLSARAQELVGGALMVLIVPSLPNGVLLSETTVGMNFDLLGSCLMDMAKSGLIREEKVGAFNLPIYYPLVKELEEVIWRNGCFSIEGIDIIAHPLKHVLPTLESVTSHLRAIMQELIKEHFGNEIVDDLFRCFAQKLSENFFITNLENRKNIELFILLKRNMN